MISLVLPIVTISCPCSSNLALDRDANWYASEYLLFTPFGDRHTKMSVAGLVPRSILPFMESIGLFSTFLICENTQVSTPDPDPDIPIHEIGATIVRTLCIEFNSIIDNETNGLTYLPVDRTASISIFQSKIVSLCDQVQRS